MSCGHRWPSRHEPRKTRKTCITLVLSSHDHMSLNSAFSMTRLLRRLTLHLSGQTYKTRAHGHLNMHLQAMTTMASHSMEAT